MFNSYILRPFLMFRSRGFLTPDQFPPPLPPSLGPALCGVIFLGWPIRRFLPTYRAWSFSLVNAIVSLIGSHLDSFSFFLIRRPAPSSATANAFSPRYRPFQDDLMKLELLPLLCQGFESMYPPPAEIALNSIVSPRQRLTPAQGTEEKHLPNFGRHFFLRARGAMSLSREC